MCGIAGILGQNLELDQRRRVVERMIQILHHRGPDGKGIEISPTFALGHTRLAILDPIGGAQPMNSADGRYWLNYNGEIYNYRELRVELTKLGWEFSSTSDSEVLLHHLIQFGVEGIKELDGIFAFAFVDSVSGEWLLARDGLGVKPLYYVQRMDNFIFSSEVKALFAYPGFAPALRWDAFEEYLTFQFYLNNKTLFQEVGEVPAGHYLRGLEGNILENAPFWTINCNVQGGSSLEAASTRLNDLLFNTVTLQLRSDAPLGTYLSGGMDSSIVTALATRANSSQVLSFHGRFPDPPQFDESSHAKAVSAELQTTLRILDITAADFTDSLQHIIFMLDYPLGGPGSFPQFMVSRFASKEVKVLLGGQGGDELFAGYARYLVAYLEQALKGAIFENQEEGNHIVTLASIIESLPLLRGYEPLMRHFFKSGLFAPMEERYFHLLDRMPSAQALLSGDAIKNYERTRVFSSFKENFNREDTRSYINKMTAFDLKTFLASLLQVEDRMSMAASVESRVPLLSTRIVEFVMSLPPAFKFAGGETKSILRRAMQDDLPKAAAQRKDKMGFPVPLNEWLQAGIVREFVMDIALSRAAQERGIFNMSAVQSMFDHEAAFGRQIWGWLSFELWCQNYLDRDPLHMFIPG